MNPTSALRLAALASVLGGAISANAYVLTIVGDVAPGGALSATSTMGNLSGLSNFTFAGTLAQPTANLVGLTARLTSGAQTISFAAQPGFSIDGDGTTSFAGVWRGTVSPTLGVRSSGSYSGSFDNLGRFSLSIAGQPVPEPASIAVFGLGLAGLLRRRRA